jgi:outer membrane protein TolC
MDSDDVILRIEREAEREIRQLETRLHDATARAEKAEAELEAARPLLEAVTSESLSLTRITEPEEDDWILIGNGQPLLRAALAYRESQPKPKEK